MIRATTILLLSVLAGGACADTWPDCTVEMEDGTRHERVDVAWKLEGFMLGLKPAAGEEYNISPVDVARIFDAGGRDVTEEVADACPADVHYALLGSKRVEPEGIGLCFDGGGSLSFTSGFGGYEPTGAIFAGLRKELSLSWHVRAQFRRQRVVESVPDVTARLGVWSNEIALLMGGRAVHPRRTRNYVYVEGGPVLVMWERRWDGEALHTVDGGDPAVGVLLRGGILFRLNEHFGLDLGAMASLRPSIEIDADHLGVVVGLNVAVAVY